MSEALVPAGARSKKMPGVIPYLLVGDAPALISFLEAGFGAVRLFSAPSADSRIMHAEIALGDSLVMISDAIEKPLPPTQLCHYVEDVDAVYARAIAAGAADLSAPETQNYGDRIAGIKDPAGNTWWICTRLT